MARPAGVGHELVREAARIIQGGGVILYPTDTVYGIGCDAFNGPAIERVFAIKGRPEDKPALVLIGEWEMLGTLAAEVPPMANTLMERFWPGPLTILFNARPEVHALIAGSRRKVGIRLPDCEFCKQLLMEASTPIVSTSANRTGAKPTQDIRELQSEFGEIVDLIIDGGPPSNTLPSTIVDVTGASLTIVREGTIPGGEIREAVGG